MAKREVHAKFSILEVKDEATAKQFLEFPLHLYVKDNNYIRPLDTDINKVFDPKQNKFFRNGDLARWILKDENSIAVGRISAFYDTKTARNNEQATGGIGFFECTNNQEAANILFDVSRDWLKSKGMEAMDGPVNFGDRDRWWGLLVDGFYPPNYCQNYNPAYYKELFENYGFQVYFEQYTYYRPINKEGIDPAIMEKAKRIAKNPAYHFKYLRKREMETFTEDFREIYNKAWTRHSGVKSITKAHAKLLLKNMKPILDEKLMWFAYYNEEPVAFFLMLPELNQIFRYVNGKLNLIGKLKVLFLKYTRSVTKAYGIIFGIVPEHQGKGVDGAIVMAFGDKALRPGYQYKELEMNWIGDFNPVMMRLVEQIGGKIIKTHYTYRYLFDRSKEFKRARKI